MFFRSNKKADIAVGFFVDAGLLDRTPGERIAVYHSVIGLDASNDDQHYRADQHQAEQGETYQNEHQHVANGRSNRHSDLKVKGFLALVINERIAFAFYLPQDYRKPP